MKLTDKECKAAKGKKKPYKMADGGGLYLLVKINGARHWRLKYRFLGKEKLLAIGPYSFKRINGNPMEGFLFYGVKNPKSEAAHKRRISQ